jgi:hypothetical protein
MLFCADKKADRLKEFLTTIKYPHCEKVFKFMDEYYEIYKKIFKEDGQLKKTFKQNKKNVLCAKPKSNFASVNLDFIQHLIHNKAKLSEA